MVDTQSVNANDFKKLLNFVNSQQGADLLACLLSYAENVNLTGLGAVRLLTKKEVGELLSISQPVLASMMKDPEFPRLIFENSTKVRVPAGELTRYISQKSRNWLNEYGLTAITL